MQSILKLGFSLMVVFGYENITEIISLCNNETSNY